MGRDLRTSVACVTGAARGIGREAALLLARKGAVVHVADVDENAAETAVAEIRWTGGEAFAQHCDVASEESVMSLFKSIEIESGRLDVLVNNAAIYPKLPFFDTTVEEFDRIISINLRGVFMCTMAAVPLMEHAGSGSVICMSSTAATLQSIEYEMPSALPVYGASKAAVDRWALNAAKQLAGRNIAMNVLYPAGILTDGSRALGLSEQYMASMSPPSAVGPAIAWLARQTPATFAGELVHAVDFGTSWGERGDEGGGE